MNEEMMTYEELDVENTTEVVAEETYEPKSAGVNTVGAFVGGALVAGAAGVGAWLWNKTKAKREELAVKKLEKKGYVVVKADPEEIVEAEIVEDVPKNEDAAK